MSGDYFTVLGVVPLLGRLIGPQDTQAEGDGFVAVLSEVLWRRRFGAAADIVGRRIALNGQEVTVIGVAASRLAGTQQCRHLL